MDTRPAVPSPSATPAAPAHERRGSGNPGDELTIDPADRKRRARAALRELSRSTAARRGGW